MDNLGDRVRSLVKENLSKMGSKGKKTPNPAAPIFALVGLGLLGYGLYNSVYVVEGGHRAIKFNRIYGIGDAVFEEGLHLAFPILERPILFDVRVRANSITSLTGSKDLQMINVAVRVLHKPDAHKLHTMYRELGLNYAERVLPSIVNEVLKSVIAQFTAAELLTKRRNVSEMIRNKLIERASHFNILVNDVSITHLEFGKEYAAAVEAKQVAQQEAERAKFIVQKALQEKRSMIVRAEGEAEAIRLVGEAVAKSKGFIDLRKIEASKEIADIISHAKNKVYLSSDSLLLNNSLNPNVDNSQKI